MKLSNRKIFLIVMFMTIALSGLVVLQAILLKTALKAEEETFRRNVILALNNVVKDLTEIEAKNAILQISINDSSSFGIKKVIKTINFNSNDTISVIHGIQGHVNNIHDSSSISYNYSFDKIEENRNINSMGVEDNKYKIAMIFEDSIDSDSNYSGFSYFQNTIMLSDSLQSKDSARIMIIEAALSQMELWEHSPIETRLDTLVLDSAIKESLSRINIELNYSFAITNHRIDSLIFNVRNARLEKLSKSPYHTVLFPSDFIVSSNYLILDFPNKQYFIYSQLLSIIIPTLFFVMIILAVFIYAVNLLLRQRKTSTRLTDFINNMTHEFKTPISTIQLATEAISRNDVFSNKEKMLSYNKMILSENKRMKSHVDKILQIATLEEGDYFLSQESIEMHLLITEVVESFSILLKQNNGNIKMLLDAQRFEIKGDRVHILNIVYNLLDNALKYSKENPQITVTTVNKNNSLEISIKDNGIGIHPNDIKYVFDKYYRVGKGNVHDIKGFGLGLSYVKMMVEAHNGSVQLLSALDKGTEVIISFPLSKI